MLENMSSNKLRILGLLIKCKGKPKKNRNNIPKNIASVFFKILYLNISKKRITNANKMKKL